jgi:hypothetical protein
MGHVPLKMVSVNPVPGTWSLDMSTGILTLTRPTFPHMTTQPCAAPSDFSLRNAILKLRVIPNDKRSLVTSDHRSLTVST